MTHDGSGLSWRVPDARRPKAEVTVVDDLPVNGVRGRSRTLPASVAPVGSKGRVVAWIVTTPSSGYGELRLTLELTWGTGCAADFALYL